MLGADYFYLLIVFFVLTGVAVAFIYASQQIVPVLQQIPNYNVPYTPATANAFTWPSPLNVTNQVLSNYNSVDSWLYFIYILVSLAILASVAFLPNVSPMAIAIGFIMLIVLAITSMVFSNAVNVFFNAPVLANAVAKLPQTRALWATIAEYEILFSLIYLVLIAARSRGGGGSGGYGGGKATLG